MQPEKYSFITIILSQIDCGSLSLKKQKNKNKKQKQEKQEKQITQRKRIVFFRNHWRETIML